MSDPIKPRRTKSLNTPGTDFYETMSAGMPHVAYRDQSSDSELEAIKNSQRLTALIILAITALIAVGIIVIIAYALANLSGISSV